MPPERHALPGLALVISKALPFSSAPIALVIKALLFPSARIALVIKALPFPSARIALVIKALPFPCAPIALVQHRLGLVLPPPSRQRTTAVPFCSHRLRDKDTAFCHAVPQVQGRMDLPFRAVRGLCRLRRPLQVHPRPGEGRTASSSINLRQDGERDCSTASHGTQWKRNEKQRLSISPSRCSTTSKGISL